MKKYTAFRVRVAVFSAMHLADINPNLLAEVEGWIGGLAPSASHQLGMLFAHAMYNVGAEVSVPIGVIRDLIDDLGGVGEWWRILWFEEHSYYWKPARAAAARGKRKKSAAA